MDDEPIRMLARELLARAEPGLLDIRLDEMADRAANDGASQIFVALHAAGLAVSLRTALDGDCLADWAESACNVAEKRILADQLRIWVGHHAPATTGVDDVARLARLDALPRESANLRRWADKHRVAGELGRLAGDVLACSSPELAQATILAAAGRELTDSTSAALRADVLALQRNARAYLEHAASSALGQAARALMWRRANPPETLVKLTTRLHELLDGFELIELAGLRFVGTRPVVLDSSTGCCRGLLIGKPFVEVRLLLAGYEHRRLEATCSACAAEKCEHRAALAARLIDACLEPRDRLREPLVAFARAPGWQRFLESVAGSNAKPSSEAALHFVLRHDGTKVEVGVTREAAREPGGDRVQKLASPQRLLRSRHTVEPDRGALAAMARCARTRGPELVPASLELLRTLVDHPRLSRAGDGARLQLFERKVQVRLVAVEGGIVPHVSIGGRPLRAAPAQSYELIESPGGQSLAFAAVTPSIRRLLVALEDFSGVLPPDSYAALTPWLQSLRDHVDLEVPEVVAGVEVSPPEKLLLRVRAYPEHGCEFLLCVRVFPLTPLWAIAEGDEVVHGIRDGRAVFTRRDFGRERALAKQVLDAVQFVPHERIGQLPCSAERGPASYSVTSDENALAVLARVAQLGDLLEIEWSEQERRIRPVGRVGRSDLHIKLKYWKGSFEVQGSAAFSGVEVSFRRLLEAAIAGERFVRLEGRNYAELEDELLTRLRDAQYAMNLTERELRVILAMAPSFIELFDEQIMAADAPTVEWLERLRHAEASTPNFEPGFESVLRPYQHDGVRWLLQRSAWSPGACLADEMGLGKTVQAIVVMSHRAGLGPALVVAPTSVLSNWAAELARFAADLRVSVYHGARRHSSLGKLGAGSVLVTSYDVMLRDHEELGKYRFATVVIDEAQMIRNARTRRARALQSIPADFRIALSGTPIENRMGDLWSLFRLVAPGFLGEWKTFRALVGVPLERERDAGRAEQLRKMLRPVLLRRTKAEVASELPARTDVVHRIEMSESEQALYRAAVKRARLALRRKKSELLQHPANSPDCKRDPTIRLLAELTRLRQLACHAGLVIPDEGIESSKLHALLRLLADILPRGHRALVFSSFTTLLASTRQALDSRGISHLYLDGSTLAGERGELVQRFQSGEADVFLISLKAGGTGLNLTAADYVIHLDPWWNPAAQNQASDRAHRIGQTRPVTVVKLVAQRTIEERILELQEQKRWLADSILFSENAAPEMDFELLEALLAD